MKNQIDYAERLFQFSKNVGGVFILSELSSLFDITDQQKLWNVLKQFEASGLLKRYCRGVYVSKEFDPQILSAKVRPESYISFGSALAAHRLIGTESPFLISCAIPGKAADFSGAVNLSYSRIRSELYFGFDFTATGVKIASPEKAVLDTLYFYQHGMTFHFNIFQDISFSDLSMEKFEAYLGKYANPKFQTFAKRVVNGNV